MRHFLSVLLFVTFSATAAASPSNPSSPLAHTAVPEQAADYSDAWRDYLTERRALQVQRLKHYADAGIFPVNTEVPGLANLFMDEEGRRCAMAHLIWEDGAENLVKVLAATQNDVRLADVTQGPLLDWILTSGLTQQEAGFIQEPDFQISPRLPERVQEQLVMQEQTRIQHHFAAALQQVEHYSEHSIDVAIARLGQRIHTQPPALPTRFEDGS